MFLKAPAALVAAALLAGTAMALPKLAASAPVADAIVASPKQVSMTFSEKLMPKFSSAMLVMTGMPGMANHAPMTVKVNSSVSADGMTLIATPVRPLPAGTYKASYKVVSADTHKIEGGYSFTVK